MRKLRMRGPVTSCSTSFEKRHWKVVEAFMAHGVTFGLQAQDSSYLSLFKHRSVAKPIDAELVDFLYSFEQDEHENKLRVYYSWSILTELDQYELIDEAVAAAVKHLKMMITWKAPRFLGLPGHLIKKEDKTTLVFGDEASPHGSDVLAADYVRVAADGRCGCVLQSRKLHRPQEIFFTPKDDDETLLKHLHRYGSMVSYSKTCHAGYLQRLGKLLELPCKVSPAS